ncbi:hypothetical protein [Nannocystis punicea]|uniref:HEAT repeat domain-containing protein n=1 Tax=Nannocystis punicea TaxID=2995304 RepID=A0ABY7H2H8_9BACT|nr:hypothetical protein [Nannocystis poenicansa]WAS93397.1 hypothetical protein O0S08_45210 [Nannocystis poenicansa]
MAVPALKSVALHQRLQAFRAEDGSLLGEVLRELAQEVEREPRNLIASTIYGHALVLAGRAQEARREALRGLALWQSLPAVTPEVTLNVVAGLGDAGFVAEAKRVLESLDARALDEAGAARRIDCAAHIAMRYGEIAWLERRHPGHPFVQLLAARGLTTGWPGLQAAVEAYLGERVASFAASIEGLEDAHKQLVLNYWTDSHSYSEIDRLQDGVWDTADGAAADAPEALYHVVYMIYGPEIPVTEIGP